MSKIKEVRNQLLYFETTPKELRRIADVLERTKQLTANDETTFILNEGDGKEDFQNRVSLRFIKPQKE